MRFEVFNLIEKKLSENLNEINLKEKNGRFLKTNKKSNSFLIFQILFLFLLAAGSAKIISIIFLYVPSNQLLFQQDIKESCKPEA